MNASFVLDEYRAERLEQPFCDTEKYIRQNEYKLLKFAQQSARPRSTYRRLFDKLKRFPLLFA